MATFSPTFAVLVKDSVNEDLRKVDIKANGNFGEAFAKIQNGTLVWLDSVSSQEYTIRRLCTNE